MSEIGRPPRVWVDARITVGVLFVEGAGQIDGAGLEFVVPLAAVRFDAGDEDDFLDVLAGLLLGDVIVYVFFRVLGGSGREQRGGQQYRPRASQCGVHRWGPSRQRRVVMVLRGIIAEKPREGS